MAIVLAEEVLCHARDRIAQGGLTVVVIELSGGIVTYLISGIYHAVPFTICRKPDDTYGREYYPVFCNYGKCKSHDIPDCRDRFSQCNQLHQFSLLNKKK